MIFDKVFEIFLSPLNSALSAVPSFLPDIDYSSYISAFADAFKLASYFISVPLFLVIQGTIFTLKIFRCLMSVERLLARHTPLIGG